MRLGVFGGTSFKNADLTDANFAGATLSNTDFSQATVIRTRFKGAEQLKRAKLDGTIVNDKTVRDLLVAGKGHRLNLREKNLEGSYLAKADLREANLTQTQAIGADFRGAKFTGACIEDWNIDADTRFDGVECDYIFQSEKPNHNGVRKRLPYNPDKKFEPGDFENSSR